MTDGEYQRLYDEVYRELVTPEWRRKLALLVEHASDPVATDRDSLRRELEEVRAARDELVLMASRMTLDYEVQPSTRMARIAELAKVDGEEGK